MENKKILIVDDEEDMLGTCVQALKKHNLQCFTTTDAVTALELIEKERPDLVLTDLKMPKYDGIQLLRKAREFNEDMLVILFTAYGTIETAVEAMKEGAYDYITKPFTSEQLRLVVQRALSQKKVKFQPNSSFSFVDIIGQSQKLKEILETVKKVSKTNSNVLIYGETGTGKELIAQAIYTNSERRGKPFVAVDCAALPETLLESELFGYEKGAFTDASTSKIGLFETADGGVLFLDEIAELGLPLQAKLLRVLQEKSIRRLGATKTIDIDVRVVSATNKDLEKAIQDSTFRADLFYRLNVVSIMLPPLRDRKEDIPLLVKNFINKFTPEGRTFEIAEETMEALTHYSWPGNIRELQNVIENIITLSDKTIIEANDLSEKILTEVRYDTSDISPKEPSYKKLKEEWLGSSEKEYLIELLKKTKGNISKASRGSGIDRTTFYKLIKKYGITF